MRSKRSKLQAFSSMILFSVFVLFPDHRIFAADWSAGPLLHDFPLTLSEGHRTEAVSPFFYSEQRESVHTWAIPPLFSHMVLKLPPLLISCHGPSNSIISP